jgi:hypothetical protein
MMRSCLFVAGTFSCEILNAHPGHGAPGVHAHLADAALIGLGIFAFSLFVYLLKKLAKR